MWWGTSSQAIHSLHYKFTKLNMCRMNSWMGLGMNCLLVRLNVCANINMSMTRGNVVFLTYSYIMTWNTKFQIATWSFPAYWLRFFMFAFYIQHFARFITFNLLFTFKLWKKVIYYFLSTVCEWKEEAPSEVEHKISHECK